MFGWWWCWWWLWCCYFRESTSWWQLLMKVRLNSPLFFHGYFNFHMCHAFFSCSLFFSASSVFLSHCNKPTTKYRPTILSVWLWLDYITKRLFAWQHFGTVFAFIFAHTRCIWRSFTIINEAENIRNEMHRQNVSKILRAQTYTHNDCNNTVDSTYTRFKGSEYLSTSDSYNETIARDTRNEKNTLFECLTK